MSPIAPVPGARSELVAVSADEWQGVCDALDRWVSDDALPSGSLAGWARELAGRPVGPCRLAILATGADDLRQKAGKARELLAGGRHRLNVGNRIFAQRAPDEAPKTAFLFPGFAAQYPDMLAELHASLPTARRWFEAQDEDARSSWRRNQLLFSSDSRKLKVLRRSSLRQIVDASLVANLSYYALAEHLGLRCDAMVGHSLGENTALIAAGMVPEVPVVTELLLQITKEHPDDASSESAFLAMAGQSLERITRDGGLGPSVSVALDNCPQQVIVCGATEEVERLEANVRAHKEVSFRLPLLSRPVHSPRFPVRLARLRELYQAIEIGPPRVPVWSCSSASPLPSAVSEIRAGLAEQWISPVRFRETVHRLYAEGFRTFVEVGPGGKLTGFVRDSLRGQELTAVSMDREGSDTLPQLQSSLALLWVRGHAVDLERLADESVGESPPPAVASSLSNAAEPAVAEPVDRDLLDCIMEHVAGVLELTDRDLLEPQSGFFELGMDSLATVELARRLERSLGIALPPTIAFDYPTPERLAEHLRSSRTGRSGRAARSSAGTTSATSAATSAATAEPLAIVGMACRFPGGAVDPDGFWQLLRDGKDAITPVPPGRWPVDLDLEQGFRQGAFLSDVETFDAAFFGISPREAVALDPQQRLLLEVAWESLEVAGIPPRDRTGALDGMGVFVGISTAEYAQRLSLGQRLEVGGYLASGNALSTAAGRIAHVLGSQGPSLAVDTACSSSLVAVHLAAQSLRRGECDVALAGGVGLLLSAEGSRYLAGAGALSPNGRCRTFDAGADGYVRGEGCGMVVLERLSDARAAGHPVLALVHGSAVNHDGHTSGLTVPNGLAQESVVERALADARVDAGAVTYVEAHGTGTSLGDPIELAALGRVFAAGGAREAPLLVGSVKTNVGHLEAAAGIAGLIKVVLQLQHGELAPSLWFDSPNPNLDWSSLPLAVCDRKQPWTATGPRTAGVSSFGISGTNAHVVVGEAPAPPAAEPRPAPRDHSLVVLSARDGGALAESARRLADHLESTPAPDLGDVAFTTQVGRHHHRVRASLAVPSMDEAVGELRRLTERAADRRPASGRRKLAFLFTGQGAQRPLMGQELLRSEAVFRQALEECDALLRSRRGSLLDVLAEPAGAGPHPLDTTAWAQPALFAVGYALAQLWRSWGIEPDAVIGHSVGELTAACVSGVLGLEDALELVAERGELMQSLPAGAMLAVAGDREEVAAALGTGLAAEVDLAAINAPNRLVLSGDPSAIEQAEERMRAAGLPATRLTVSHAFHSRSMEPILEPFGRVAAGRPHRRPHRILVSNLTGAVVDRIADPAEHWTRHLREPVNFAAGIETVRAAGCDVFLEIGPRPVLLGLAQDGAASASDAFLASLHPPRTEEAQMLTSLGRLYELGFDVDWRGFTRGREGRVARLPTYPFQRERYWIEPAVDRPPPSRRQGATAPVSLPGDRRSLPGAPAGARFEAELSNGSLGFLGDHRVAGSASLPISALLDAALRATEGLEPGTRWQIEDFVAHVPLTFAGEGARQLHTVVDPEEGGGHHCRFFGRDANAEDDPWQLHAEARLRPFAPCAAEPRTAGGAPETQPGAESLVVGREQFYATCRQAGFDYGPAFQVLRELTLGEQGARGVADAALPAAVRQPGGQRTLSLEVALQTVGVLVGSQEQTAGLLLREIGGVRLWGELDRVVAEASLAPADGSQGELRAEVALLDAGSGEVVGELVGIRYLPAPSISEHAAAEAAGSAPRDRLLSAIADENGHSVVSEYLRELACEILHFPSDRALDAGQPLPEMGFDSIMAVWFRNRLESDLGIEIEPSEYLREPTLEHLAGLVRGLLLRPSEARQESGWVEGEL